MPQTVSCQNVAIFRQLQRLNLTMVSVVLFAFTCISRPAISDWWGWCKRCDVTVILLAQTIKRRGQSCKSANRSQSYCPSEFSGPQTIHYIHGRPIMHVYVGNSSENIQIQEIFRHVKKVNVVNTCQFSLTVPNCNTPGYVFTKTSATFLSFTPQHCNYCTHHPYGDSWFSGVLYTAAFFKRSFFHIFLKKNFFHPQLLSTPIFTPLIRSHKF